MIDKSAIKKIFVEILVQYEKAEKKNLEQIIANSPTGYDRQMERLKNEVAEYKNRLNELLDTP